MARRRHKISPVVTLGTWTVSRKALRHGSRESFIRSIWMRNKTAILTAEPDQTYSKFKNWFRINYEEALTSYTFKQGKKEKTVTGSMAARMAFMMQKSRQEAYLPRETRALENIRFHLTHQDMSTWLKIKGVLKEHSFYESRWDENAQTFTFLNPETGKGFEISFDEYDGNGYVAEEPMVHTEFFDDAETAAKYSERKKLERKQARASGRRAKDAK